MLSSSGLERSIQRLYQVTGIDDTLRVRKVHLYHGLTANSKKLLKLRDLVLFRKTLALTSKIKRYIYLRKSALVTSEPGTCIQEVAGRYFEIGHDFKTFFLCMSSIKQFPFYSVLCRQNVQWH